VFIGFGFLFGMVFGVASTITFQLYIGYKLFNYEDYLSTSKQIEDNRQFWKDRIDGYQELIRRDSSDLGNYSKKENNDPKEHLTINSDLSFSGDEGLYGKDDEKSKKERMKQKVIEKSLHDLNDRNSNIMLSTGYTPLFRKESRIMLNIGTHKDEDQNFEVQFHSRLLKYESYVKHFINHYGNVAQVEYQMSFKNIVDQKAKYSITKKKNFNIFKKDNKWVQIRYLLKSLEHLHRDNALFIENAVKGQFEAFLQQKTEKFSEHKVSYDELKKLKYKSLDGMNRFKAKHKESKEELDEVLLIYEKAKSKGNTTYNKLLKMEMDAKLAQKSVQDEASNMIEAKGHIKEIRDETKQKKKDILFDLSIAYRDKLETFNSTVFSIINAYSE
jgi:hypothetical protein